MPASFTIRHDGVDLRGNEWVVTVDDEVNLEIKMTLLTDATVCATHFDVEKDGPSGQTVRVLYREETLRADAHVYNVVWDSRDEQGSRVAPGRYHLVGGLHSLPAGCDIFRSGWGFGLGYFNVPQLT